MDIKGDVHQAIYKFINWFQISVKNIIHAQTKITKLNFKLGLDI